jgi:hypothetical protein
MTVLFYLVAIAVGYYIFLLMSGAIGNDDEDMNFD